MPVTARAARPWPQGSRLRIFAGACAIALGLGVVRFDFAALARQMLAAHWLHPWAIGRLAALNLIGYVLGCLHHTRIGRLQLPRLMVMSLSVIVGSLWLEAFGLGGWWQGLWRLLAGWASGSLMAGIPGLALQGLAGSRRRRGTALVMAGAGVGAVFGALAIGSLAPRSPSMAWGVLAVLGSLLSIPVAWLIRSTSRQPLPAPPGPDPSLASTPAAQGAGSRRDGPQAHRALALGYFLMGASQVPVVLYEPLLVSRRLGLDPALSSDSLSLLGFGCATGALLAASVPRAWPTRSLLALSSCVGLAGSLLFLFGQALTILAVATFLTGVWIFLMVTLTYDRLQELVPETQHRRHWAWLTALLGLGFMLFSLGCSGLAAEQLTTVLMLGTAIMVLHVLMEFWQMQRHWP